MKRIAIIAHGLTDGGAERVASILANYFASHEYDVLCVCPYGKDENKVEYQIDERVTVKYIEVTSKQSLFRFLSRNRQIKKAVKQFKPEYVISFINCETLFLALTKIPIIYTLRTDPQHARRPGLLSKILDLEYARAYKIVFQTEGARNAFSKKIQNKSVVIANPLVTKKLPLWKENKHKKVFITACRLHPQKNLDMLIEAFYMVHQIHPDYRLEIYGEGDLRTSLTEHIHSLKADDYIFLKGYAQNIHTIMAESSGFVMSSDYEGLSNSMLEALCIGVPCICTDCPPGGPRDFIENGLNGFLTSVGDPQEMKEKICKLIENEELVLLFSERSLTYRTKLDVDRICAVWQSLLR